LASSRFALMRGNLTGPGSK
jgi:hypothetical protein